MAVSIPTTKLPPATREPRNLFIYGRPKVGKSTLCSKLPSALHLDLQQGTLFLETQRVVIDTADQLVEVTQALPAHWKAHPFRFLVVDVVDQVEDWSEGLATALYRSLPTGKNFGGQSVLELDHGAGYRWLRNAFKETVRALLANSMWQTVFVGHVRDKYADDKSKLDAKVREADVDLTGKIKSMMCQMVDAIGYAYRDANGQLRLSFETTDAINCGNRAQHLAGRTLAFSTPPRWQEWGQVYPDTIAKIMAEEAAAQQAAAPTTTGGAQ